MTGCRIAPRTGQPQIADRRGNRLPSHGLLGTAISVLGLLPMLQALEHARRSCVGTLIVKLAPIANGRDVRVFGLNVQFAGHTTSSATLLVTVGITYCEITAAVDGSRPPFVIYRRQPRVYAENLPSMSLTSSGMWSMR
jgi:hypothetical protein